MSLRVGDKIDTTRQIDGSFNVVVDIKHSDGDRRFVANVKSPNIYYARMRDLMDNPPVRDLDAERESLLMRKAEVENEIVKVDAEILIREAPPKEVIR